MIQTSIRNLFPETFQLYVLTSSIHRLIGHLPSHSILPSSNNFPATQHSIHLLKDRYAHHLLGDVFPERIFQRYSRSRHLFHRVFINISALIVAPKRPNSIVDLLFKPIRKFPSSLSNSTYPLNLRILSILSLKYWVFVAAVVVPEFTAVIINPVRRDSARGVSNLELCQTVNIIYELTLPHSHLSNCSKYCMKVEPAASKI